jgi:hypothetical protein
MDLRFGFSTTDDAYLDSRCFGQPQSSASDTVPMQGMRAPFSGARLNARQGSMRVRPPELIDGRVD